MPCSGTMSAVMKHEPACSGEKRCSVCHEVKPVLAFATHPTNRDGMQHYCRPCGNKRAADYRSARIQRESVRLLGLME